MNDTPLTHKELKKAESVILKSYWRSNLIFMGILLCAWASVSLGCGIFFADTLNQFKLPGTGYPLGFWFAQQGSIITFVAIILIYALGMNRLDRLHHEQRAKLCGIEPKQEDSFTGEGI